jgi:uncharacterized protein YndB with AHSA1/START domain
VTTDAYSTSVRIEAPPVDVFPYLTDSKLMVEWMGEWADLAPEPGGSFALDINGIPIRGEYVAVEPPHRVVFTWGVPGNDVLLPGSTTVEITLTADGDDTVLELVHSNLPPDEVPRHGDGWSHFLSRLVVRAAGGDPGPDSWASAARDS